MRYFLFCALAALLLVTPSCKKEKSTAERLNGKWKLTKMVTDGEDVVQGDSDYRIDAELEFTNGGSLVFNFTEYDFTSTPVGKESYSIVATYTISGDNTLNINFNDGNDALSVTGPVDVNATHFLYTPTSGDTQEFITLMEGEKE